MATKQIIFLNNVKTPYGDVSKGEILTGTEFTKNPPVGTRGQSIPGFLFNFYEKKDPARYLDKSAEEVFFIPNTSFGDNKTIREVKQSDLTKPKEPIVNVNVNVPVKENTITEPTNNSNKIVSFVLGALIGIIAGHFVLNKMKK